MQLSWQILTVGSLVSAMIAWFAHRYLRYRPRLAGRLWRNLRWLVLYGLVLVAETGKATLAVIKIVLSPDPKAMLQPCLLYFKSDLKSNAAKVVLANSITLTPGTLTVDLDHDTFCIHCLNPSLAEDIDSSIFVRLLKQIEQQIEGGRM